MGENFDGENEEERRRGLIISIVMSTLALEGTMFVSVAVTDDGAKHSIMIISGRCYPE